MNDFDVIDGGLKNAKTKKKQNETAIKKLKWAHEIMDDIKKNPRADEPSPLLKDSIKKDEFVTTQWHKKNDISVK